MEAHYADYEAIKNGNGMLDLPDGMEDALEVVLQKYTAQIARLPMPLELMNYDDLATWLRPQIILNRYERGLKGTKIGYGHPLWKPDFWPTRPDGTEYWQWSEFNVNPLLYN